MSEHAREQEVAREGPVRPGIEHSNSSSAAKGIDSGGEVEGWRAFAGGGEHQRWRVAFGEHVDQE